MDRPFVWWELFEVRKLEFVKENFEDLSVALGVLIQAANHFKR